MTEVSGVDDEDALLLVRPSDLATLRIVPQDLDLEDGKLRRTGDEPLLLVSLPPQHFRENLTVPVEGIALVAATAPTVLIFELAPDQDEFELGEGGLLGLCDTAALRFSSVIAVPAKAVLGALSAQWELGARPVVLNGRGSLWRARLVGPVVDGAVRGRLKVVGVQDVVSDWDVLPSTPDLTRMADGVLQASRFDFSPIGVTARFRGPVDFGFEGQIPPERQDDADIYEHDIDYGRDSRVRVVSHGHLSSGHLASLVQLRRRVFIGGNEDGSFRPDGATAELTETATLVVTDPVLAVGALGDAYGGPARDMPLRSLRLLTTYVTDISDANSQAAFWVQVAGRDVEFALQALDWAGNVVTFSMPLVFIPGTAAFDQTRQQQFAAVFEEQKERRRKPAVDSASIALLPPESAVAPMTVDEVHIGFQIPAPGTTRLPVLPVLTGARVVVDAATHFTGVRTAVDTVWDEAYRRSGLSNVPGDLGTYLHLTEKLTVDFGDPRRIGALAQPTMEVAALSAVKGALPAGFDPSHPVDSAALLAQFAGAKVLGAIKLTDIVNLELLVGKQAPELSEHVTPQGVELKYTFTSPIKDNPLLAPMKEPAPKKGEPEESAIELTATVARRLADGASTTSMSGRITRVEISLLGIVTLSFVELKFSAEPGKGVSIDHQGMALTFQKDLQFLQTIGDELKSILPGGTSIDVRSDRMTAGFSVAVPELTMGMFSLTNLSVGALLTVPFDGTPLRFTFAVGSRFKPFSVMVSLFTGGGFLALTMTSQGIEQVEASLEFGGSMQLNLVVASGGLSVMAGIYFRLDAGGQVTLGGYLRASGQVTVLGIITISADFFMQISYESSTNEAIGQASLTLGIKVLFFSKSVTLSVERRFSAVLGDPAFTDLYELEDWAEYCDAFA